MGGEVVPMTRKIINAKLAIQCAGLTPTGVVVHPSDFIAIALEQAHGEYLVKMGTRRGESELFGLTVTQGRHIPIGEFRIEVGV